MEAEVLDISDVRCEIDLSDDEHAGRNESLLPYANDHQRLRNSYSEFTFEEKENIAAGATQSATLDNGDLSKDCLRQARDTYCRSLSCTSCTSPVSHMLPVEGMRDVFHCSSCASVHGVDDSMNYYDLLQKGDYNVEPCITCGNTDPNWFLLEYGSSPGTINLRCMKCMINYECKCKNSNPELQKIDIDFSSNTVFVKCWVCEREDVKVLSRPQLCTCNNSELIEVRFDEYGYASRLVCLQCQAEVDCGVRGTADNAASGDGTSTGRKRILCLSDIHIGDHIAWHQSLGYWHHAIVTDISGGHIRVIHYDGPSLPKKGEVVEEWIPVDISEELYRINYKSSDCSHPSVVVDRARTRLHECKYNLLTNNCEHFARWCKTGHNRSMQSESFLKSMRDRAATLLGSYVASGSKWLFSTSQGNAVMKHAANIISSTGSGEAVKAAAQQAVSAELVPHLSAAGLPQAIMITREIQTVCRDIHNAHRQRRDGHISRDEFIKITIKRVSEGCGSVAGVGVALAIPISRNPIGCTLASVIGHGAGAVVGRSMCRLYAK